MREQVSLAARSPCRSRSIRAPRSTRDLIVYLTVAVTFITLVGQVDAAGAIKSLGLSSSGAWAPDEAVARWPARRRR
jgi:hypothetical protein